MTRRKTHSQETSARLIEAEKAAESVAEQGDRVDRQLSLVERLTAGWRRVHETNHLAKLFREEGRI